MSLPDRVREVLNQSVPMASRWLLAVSGGADSVALFRLCVALGLEFEVAHFDHQLRTESVEDARFVKTLAENFGKPCHVAQSPVALIARQKAWNLEEAARTLRYEFLARTAKKIRADYILTAHTLDDQVETVFMQLLRGAAQVAGMKPLQRRVFRPLLSIAREDLLIYLDSLKQEYRTDKSNFDTGYTRAWLRYEIFPVIEKRYPRFKAHVAGLADAQRLQLHFMQGVARQILQFEDVDMKQLTKMHPAIQRQVIAAMLQKHRLEKSGERIGKILALLQSETPKRLSLSKDKQARAAYGKLSIVKSSSQTVQTEPVSKSNQLPKAVNPDVLLRYPDLHYRSRQPGDRIHLQGGSKKLKEVLIDQKIPREDRDSLKVLASGAQVFWVEGVATDPDVLGTKENRDTGFMKLALKEAKLAAQKGELPVGAVLVSGENVLAKAHNLTEQSHDPSAHAEVLAIRQAAQLQGDWRLSDCTLYVTLEPCPMCFGVLLQAHIAKVVFGAANFREGALGSVTDLNKLAWKRKLEVKAGVLEKPCSKLLSEFFAKRR